MKTIKLTFTDNDILNTKINGTEKEIITHYKENNFFNWCSNSNNKQVKGIEFLEGLDKENLTGCKEVNISYVFFDYQNNGLLQ